MAPAYAVGVDVGTSGAKAVAVDLATGDVAAESTTEYPLSTPRPRWSEQEPADWVRGVCASLRDVAGAIDPAAVVGLGFTGQMHGLTLLDERGEPLRPAILWNDQRTEQQCAQIETAVGPARVRELTGNPVLTGFTAPKITWVREHEPEVHAKSRHALLPKDYVRYVLTGTMATDVADASGTSMLNVRERAWCEEMIDAAGAHRSWLPEVHESPAACAQVSAHGAAQCGLPAGLPVAAGAGDQAAQALGMGLVSEGAASVTVGTSGVVFAPCRDYRVDPDGRLHAFCHAVPGEWHLMGVMLSAGGSLQWRRDALGGDSYEALIDNAAATPLGAEGLIFLPYLTGERMPYADPHARGAFIGLTRRHDAAHLTRAVVEGVTFGLRDGLGLIEQLGVAMSDVRLSGGGTRHPWQRRVMADVFRRRLSLVNTTAGAAYGAAMLGATAGGAFDRIENVAAAWVRTTDAVEPDPKAADAYDEVYAIFHSLYATLAPTFHALSSWVDRSSGGSNG